MVEARLSSVSAGFVRKGAGGEREGCRRSMWVSDYMFLGRRGIPGELSLSAESYHGSTFLRNIAGHGEYRGLFV